MARGQKKQTETTKAVVERPVFDLDAANRIKQQIERAENIQQMIEAASQADDYAAHAKAYAGIYEEGWQQARLGFECMIEAMYKGGKMLIELPKNKGGNPQLLTGAEAVEKPLTYRELGITDRRASEWLLVGGLDESSFETWLSDQNNKDKLSKSDFLKYAKKILGKESPSQPAASSSASSESDDHPLITQAKIINEMLHEAWDNGWMDVSGLSSEQAQEFLKMFEENSKGVLQAERIAKAAISG